jgi:fimbrial isopeptide formation D2 family protein/uncharacterized repeat protein (TIGR01451 family)
MRSHLQPKTSRVGGQYRYLLATIVGIFSSNLCWMSGVLAQSTSIGATITNQATGSFIDPTDGLKSIESNIVSVTVAEVAGITISDPTVIEPTATTIGATAAPFQGIAGINQGDILYFDFVITNAGNDPTQFFIPGQPFQVNNHGAFDRAQFGAVQIVEVKDGSGVIVPLPGGVSKIDLPLAGANTGAVGILDIPGGAIPAGGSVKVRIPIKVTGSSGNAVKVSLGDTGTNDNGINTVNQPYTASATTGADVHTQDNNDNTSIDTPIIGEANGAPITGEKEASRFGLAAIVATPQVVGFTSVKLTDSNADSKINPGETVTWTIDYVNTGTIDVNNFQITDLLPANVTKSGAISISVGGTGQTLPTINSSYTGTNTTPGTTDLLLNAPILFKAGGIIRVTIPVTINSGVTGSLTNQATAIADNLPTTGIKTDNIGQTSDLPADLQATPYSITIPNSSISQTITTAIDPTSITVENPIASNPNLLLVKRITGINGSTTTTSGDDLAVYKHEPTNPYDENTTNPNPAPPLHAYTNKWPSSGGGLAMIGGTNGGMIKPNDSIEYTIYFLSTGSSDAKKVLFCDRVPNHVTFMPNAFNSSPSANSQGLSGVDRGIAVRIGNTLEAYTNVADNDLARYFPPTQNPTYRDYAQSFPGITDPAFLDKNICDGANNNGAVVVNLGNIPKADSPNNPPESFGFIRFQCRVK